MNNYMYEFEISTQIAVLYNKIIVFLLF